MEVNTFEEGDNHMPSSAITVSRREPIRIVVAVSAIDPDPYNPRKVFDPSKLQGLADSIRERGLLQPPGIRPHPDPIEQAKGRYMIICGERRWRAHGLLELQEIRVELYDTLEEPEVRLMQLAENAARDDLNLVEEAEGYQRALDALHDHSYPAPQRSLASALGMNETTLSKKLKVLTYPEQIRALIRDGVVTQVNALSTLVKLKPADQAIFVDHARLQHAEGQKVEVAKFLKDPAKYLRGLRKQAEPPAPLSDLPGGPRREPVWSTRLIIGRPQFSQLVKITGCPEVTHEEIQAADEGSLRELFEKFKEWAFPMDGLAAELGVTH